MRTIILFVCVKVDGTGDFSHFLDIYNHMKNMDQIKNLKIIPVINCDLHEDTTIQRFKEKMKQAGLDDYFIGNRRARLYEEPALQSYLSQALMTIQISNGIFPGISNYKKYLPTNVTAKFIGEHESDLAPLIGADVKDRSMGLMPNRYGIKLCPPSPQDLRLTLENNNNDFLEQLLVSTATSNLHEFKNKNFLIPAYFNKLSAFIRLILLLSTNHTLLGGKDFAIFFSGDIENLSSELESNIFSREGIDHSYYQSSDIKEIVIIGKNSSSSLEIISNGKRSIRIFHGYHLTDQSYDAIYSQAILAGISGDNTLEKAIASRAFPFYWSTNSDSKKLTLIALREIVSKKLEELEVSDQLKIDFATYFEWDNFSRFVTLSRYSSFSKSAIESFQKINFVEMLKIWPSIAEYLIQEHNFYSKLSEIVMEDLHPDKLECTDQPDASQMRNTGDYAYHAISTWKQPVKENPMILEEPQKSENNYRP